MGFVGDKTPVCRRHKRLQVDGLDKHETGQAIGFALAEHSGDFMKAGLPAGDPDEPYWAKLERVTAEGWMGGR